MFFGDIPYKGEEKKFLIHQLEEKRIPHAQLFLGQEGSGALALALAYVAYIYCEDKSETDSCGKCKACNLTHRLIHPDLHLAFPVIKKEGLKREETTSDSFIQEWRKTILGNPYSNVFDWTIAMGGDSKPNINTRECNEIIQKLGLQSFTNGPKVMLIWLPEFLGKEGNRLLKLIEEPTADTYIILVSEDQNRILPTILSRCQLVKVALFDDAAISMYLKTKAGLSDDSAALEEIIRLAGGNMSKALRLATGEENTFSDLLLAWLRTSYAGGALELSKQTNELALMSVDRQQQFCEYGLHFMREFLFWTITGSEPKMSNAEKEASGKLANLMTEDKIYSIVSVIQEVIYAINRNANQKVLWMAQSIVVGDILRNKANNYVEKFNFANQI